MVSGAKKVPLAEIVWPPPPVWVKLHVSMAVNTVPALSNSAPTVKLPATFQLTTAFGEELAWP